MASMCSRRKASGCSRATAATLARRSAVRSGVRRARTAQGIVYVHPGWAGLLQPTDPGGRRHADRVRHDTTRAIASYIYRGRAPLLRT